MNLLNFFNSQLNEINESKKYFLKNKKEIEKLEKLNNDKKQRNKRSFDIVINKLKEKEEKIKSIMDNKNFSFFKFIDFINKNDIVDSVGFNINNTGTLVSEVKSKLQLEPISINFNNSNTEAIYTFNEKVVSNEMVYSFYNEKGLPILPKNILVKYGIFEDELYEPFYRYFNRSITDTFINYFPFEPKKIKSIKVIFEEPINTISSFCYLNSLEYDTSDKSITFIKIKNNKKLKSFNLRKVSYEPIGLDFSFTEDNLNFKPIYFKDDTAILELENKEDFKIAIKNKYKEYKPKKEYLYNNLNINKNESLEKAKDNFVKTNIQGIIESLIVQIPFSSLNILEDKTKRLELNINDFVEEIDGIYQLKKEFVVFSTIENIDINKLKLYDDFSVLKRDNKYFSIYLDKKSNTIFFPQFLNQINLFFSLETKTLREQLAPKYLTPMLFQLSIKG